MHPFWHNMSSWAEKPYGFHMSFLNIFSECGKHVQKEYKWRHDNVERYVHWQFGEKLE